MNRPDVDWAYLLQGTRWSLAACALALLALGVSWSVRADYAGRLDQQHQQLQALDQERVALGDRVHARQQYRERFQALAAAGVIGGEHRLQWTQALRDSARLLRLPYLRYSTMPRQRFDAPYLDPAGMATVMATPMELQAGLVHEGDLLRLLSRLHEQTPGSFAVSGCSLEWVSASTSAAPAPDRANLNGSCQLSWFSIPLAGTGPGMDMETGG